MRSRALVTVAALAGAVLVLLPLGGGALAATSNGANGDIAFVERRRSVPRQAAPAHLVHRRRDRSVVVARREEARVLVERLDRDVHRQQPGPVYRARLSIRASSRSGRPTARQIAYVNGGEIYTIAAERLRRRTESPGRSELGPRTDSPIPTCVAVARVSTSKICASSSRAASSAPQRRSSSIPGGGTSLPHHAASCRRRARAQPDLVARRRLDRVPARATARTARSAVGPRQQARLRRSPASTGDTFVSGDTDGSDAGRRTSDASSSYVGERRLADLTTSTQDRGGRRWQPPTVAARRRRHDAGLASRRRHGRRGHRPREHRLPGDLASVQQHERRAEHRRHAVRVDRHAGQAPSR